MPRNLGADLSDEYRIFETDQYQKDLRRLRIKEGSSKYRKIHEFVYRQLRQNPYYGKNIKKLKDWQPETWRYRIGSYRLFYEVDGKERIIAIIAIEPRDKAY